MSYKYVIVTPVRNEEVFLPKTINSVLDQSIPPERWYIINDRSTDSTPEIIRDLEEKYDWVTGVDNTENTEELGRRIGGQAVIHLGLDKIYPDSYDFIVRMDSDVTFAPSFFANIFAEFDKNPQLGIASGVCYVKEGEDLVEEKHPRFHTRGPLKIYKSECFQDIGGLDPEEGWDTIDEIKAHLNGWKTWSFPDRQVIHLRKTQTSSGVLRGLKNIGKVSYYTGYHPVYAILRSLRRMLRKPFFIGGFYMLAGYLEGYIKRLPRLKDPAFIDYLRTQQMNRLKGKETIWK